MEEKSLTVRMSPIWVTCIRWSWSRQKLISHDYSVWPWPQDYYARRERKYYSGDRKSDLTVLEHLCRSLRIRDLTAVSQDKTSLKPGGCVGDVKEYSENVPMFHGRVWRTLNRIETRQKHGGQSQFKFNIGEMGKKGSSNKMQEFLGFKETDVIWRVKERQLSRCSKGVMLSQYLGILEFDTCTSSHQNENQEEGSPYPGEPCMGLWSQP